MIFNASAWASWKAKLVEIGSSWEIKEIRRNLWMNEQLKQHVCSKQHKWWSPQLSSFYTHIFSWQQLWMFHMPIYLLRSTCHTWMPSPILRRLCEREHSKMWSRVSKMQGEDNYKERFEERYWLPRYSKWLAFNDAEWRFSLAVKCLLITPHVF